MDPLDRCQGCRKFYACQGCRHFQASPVVRDPACSDCRLDLVTNCPTNYDAVQTTFTTIATPSDNAYAGPYVDTGRRPHDTT